MKYNFSNYEYMKSTGKNPKGTGHWAFGIVNATVEGIAPEMFVEQVSTYRKDTIFWVPGVCTLGEAKKKAKVFLEAAGVPETASIYVAP